MTRTPRNSSAASRATIVSWNPGSSVDHGPAVLPSDPIDQHDPPRIDLVGRAFAGPANIDCVVNDPFLAKAIADNRIVPRRDPVAAFREDDAMQLASCLLERLEWAGRAARSSDHDSVVGLVATAIVARIKKIIEAGVP